MADIFNTFIQTVLASEGGYSDNPADAGGQTNWGWTAASAAQAGFTAPIASMTRPQAIALYQQRNWTGPQFDQVAVICPSIGLFLLDTGVNMGVATGGLMLQRLLNVLNNGGQLWEDVALDGVTGAATRSALTACLFKRGPMAVSVLMQALKGLRDARYIELAEQAVRNETFEWGWLLRVLQLSPV